MRAHQIMTRQVITVRPDASIVEAAKIMLGHHISGLPVVDEAGRLVGIVSEGDFLRRQEIGTPRRRARWLQLLLGPGHAATEFVHEHGRKVRDIMTADPKVVDEDTALADVVQQMEQNGIKRLPVTRGEHIVGIVTRKNLLRAVADLARDVPDPTADDDRIRDRITSAIEAHDWRPLGLTVLVRNGVVHLDGIITDERTRHAAVVAAEKTSGVKEVHDHLCWVDPMSGLYLSSPEDERLSKAV
jgi:CBS domain-containing protein